MKNPALNAAILRILARIETGLKETTLQNETEIAMARPDLTTDEFLDALGYLADHGLVDAWTNLLGDKARIKFDISWFKEDGKDCNGRFARNWDFPKAFPELPIEVATDAEIAAGGFELPMLSTGDLYMENMDAYDALKAWPAFEMTVTARYENESGDGEDILTLTREADFEMGIALSYMRPDYTWSETIPPDSFYVQPWEESDEIRYVINDPDAVTDPLTFSVDLSWNGRHAQAEEYEEVLEKNEYTIVDSEGGETPHVGYTRQLVLRRPDWMPEEGTLHVRIIQRLASTGELWVRDYDYEYPVRYDWES